MTRALPALTMLLLAQPGVAHESWQSLPALPRGLAAFAMAVDSQHRPVVVGGSYWDNKHRQLSGKILRLEPSARAWHCINSLDTRIAYAGAAGDGTRVFLAGGLTPEGLADEIREVD